MTLWISIYFLLFMLMRNTISWMASSAFDLYHVFVIYSALRMDYWKGFIFSLALGYLLGSLSAFPSGEFIFSFSVLFTVIYSLSRVINMENRGMWILLPGGGTFLNMLSIIFIRKITGNEFGIEVDVLLQAVLSCLLLNLLRLTEKRENVVISST